jgi:hypothetical protein
MSFTIRKTVTIQINEATAGRRGVIVQQPVVDILGQDYLPLTYRNKRVATLFHGRGGDRSWPRTVVYALKKARNDYINNLICDRLRAEDPLADAANIVLDKKQRAMQFHAANLPLALDVPMDDGSCLKMLAGSGMTGHQISLCIASTELEWLKSACGNAGDDSDASDESDDTDWLDELNDDLPKHFTLQAVKKMGSMGRRQKHYRLMYCHRAGGKRVRFQRDLRHGHDEDIDAFKTKLASIVREIKGKCDGERDGSDDDDDDDVAESTVSNSAASGSNAAASGAK